jgi:uncharacterized membrane protein YdjX (TVP38/TMEM64 family)
VAVIASYFIFDLGQYCSVAYIKEKQASFELFYSNNKLLSVVLYVILYIFVIALSIPVANIMVVLASAIAGPPLALILSSFAGAFGALFSFLITRYLFKDYFQRKFSNKLDVINKCIHKDGTLYLFALRVNPLFPFFLVNILIGLTPMRAATFYWVSQIGMLPDTLILVFLGQELSKINSLQEVMTPAIIISLIALGLFPLLAKWVMSKIVRRHCASPPL